MSRVINLCHTKKIIFLKSWLYNQGDFPVVSSVLSLTVPYKNKPPSQQRTSPPVENIFEPFSVLSFSPRYILSEVQGIETTISPEAVFIFRENRKIPAYQSLYPSVVSPVLPYLAPSSVHHNLQ